MIPPVVELAKQSADLVELIGNNPFRFFAFGDAGEKPQYPYVTYQNIAGAPENYLGDRPDADGWILQINCWAKSEVQVVALAKAVSESLELSAHITGWGNSDRDPVTRNYRFTFTVEIIDLR